MGVLQSPSLLALLCYQVSRFLFLFYISCKCCCHITSAVTVPFTEKRHSFYEVVMGMSQTQGRTEDWLPPTQASSGSFPESHISPFLLQPEWLSLQCNSFVPTNRKNQKWRKGVQLLSGLTQLYIKMKTRMTWLADVIELAIEKRSLPSQP